MRIGLVTGGGDCPGLNAVIRAVVRKGIFHFNDDFVGFLEGWRGVVEDRTMCIPHAFCARCYRTNAASTAQVPSTSRRELSGLGQSSGSPI